MQLIFCCFDATIEALFSETVVLCFDPFDFKWSVMKLASSVSSFCTQNAPELRNHLGLPFTWNSVCMKLKATRSNDSVDLLHYKQLWSSVNNGITQGKKSYNIILRLFVMMKGIYGWLRVLLKILPLGNAGVVLAVPKMDKNSLSFKIGQASAEIMLIF